MCRTCMNTLIFAIIIVFNAGAVYSAESGDKQQMKVTTVENVDLEKYTGVWYEIAKIPNRFQKKCAKGTTATYTLREDGQITVVNRCVKEDGKVIQAKGIAKVADKTSNAKLKVSFVKIFGLSLFWGDYWILGLDEDYEYAVVGTHNRKYGWILARSPVLSPDKLKTAHEILRLQGYDPADFVPSDHD